MTSLKFSTVNPAAGVAPGYVMGTGETLVAEKGFIGGECTTIKSSITGDDYNFGARHLVTGEVFDRYEDVGYTNQFRWLAGYNNIWTGNRPNDTEIDPSTSGESHPNNGNCFHIRTDKNANGRYGIMLGDWTGHNALRRRWSCPIGIQFEWANKYSNSSSVGFCLSGLDFYYMSKRFQSSQYLRLVENIDEDSNNSGGMFKHPDSGTSGNNLTVNRQEEVGSNDKTGKFIAFVEEEGIPKLKDRNELFYLHAIEMRFEYNGQDNTNKKKFLHFYNFKLLYDTDATINSRQIIPKVHHRDDFFRNGGYPI